MHNCRAGKGRPLGDALFFNGLNPNGTTAVKGLLVRKGGPLHGGSLHVTFDDCTLNWDGVMKKYSSVQLYTTSPPTIIGTAALLTMLRNDTGSFEKLLGKNSYVG